MEKGIKYQSEFKEGNYNLNNICIDELDYWRQIFYKHRLIGKDKDRYNGEGYGNVSMRLDNNSEKNKKNFVITGSGTGGLEKLSEKDYSIVLEYYPLRNLVVVQKGLIAASSESMTHGTVYDLNNSAKYVFHAHSQDIWKNASRFGIPITKMDITYGTPEMAFEVERLFKETNVLDIGIFAMGGHEDGIISFGRTAEDTGETILYYLTKSDF